MSEQMFKVGDEVKIIQITTDDNFLKKYISTTARVENVVKDKDNQRLYKLEHIPYGWFEDELELLKDSRFNIEELL